MDTTQKLADSVLALPPDERGRFYKMIEAAETAMHPPKHGTSERLAKGLNLPRLLGKTLLETSDADLMQYIEGTSGIELRRDGSIDEQRAVLAACIHPSQRRQGHPGGATIT